MHIIYMKNEPTDENTSQIYLPQPFNTHNSVS